MARVLPLLAVCSLLSACYSSSETMAPKFSEAEYGKSSPRVVASNSKRVPEGGGRHVVGDPYRVAGKTYIPQDDPVGYTATGYASWYGSNFHGRKTANGEVYDMRDLTAAHPTLPLPCYARVTNLSNGRSIVVRVNDRGPFRSNRVIDVSSQTAAMLDFKRAGTAKVQVDYIGPARLDGKDQKVLMASYRAPGAQSPRTIGAPTTMVASNDVHPPKPGIFRPGTKTRPTIDFSVADENMAFGPTPASSTVADPIGPLILQTGFVSSFADAPEPYRFTPAQAAASELATGSVASRPIPAPKTVQLGTFADADNATRVAGSFAGYGDVAIAEDVRGGKALRIVRVRTIDPESVIAAAGKLGLTGARVLSSAD